MEGSTSAVLRKATYEMDTGLTTVMPDSWHGHARVLIKETEGLSHKQEAFAEELSRRLLEKEKTQDAERAARASIKKAQEKF